MPLYPRAVRNELSKIPPNKLEWSLMALRDISLRCGIWSLSGHSGLWQAVRPADLWVHGLAIDHVQQVVDVSRKLRDMRLFYEIQVAASYWNNMDAALAYGAPSAGTSGIGDLYPIVKIGGAQKHNSSRKDFGIMGIERANAMVGNLCKSTLYFNFWQRRGLSE